ncbi:PAZ domain protein [Teladorsagia circumcincta]|uniref:PAZ domain protein n=1 Tax=Teladorsagia circumcincta TaxID=45464 RepID=A0A2G9UHV5_TELCI|nr:PAZ domain protein [Teladorsagia circumcincta]
MYRVSGIEYNMTPDSTFTLNNGTVTTLKNYFENQYNLKIRASRQPVLISEGKSKQPNGAPQYAYLLPELCYPTGLTDAMRKDFRHMRELSKHTRLDPEKRRQTTETLLSMIHSNEKCCALLERWGIHLDRRLVSFKSRELYPEKLLGSAPGGYTGYRAEWAKNVRNNGNFRGIDLRNWVVIAPNTAEGDRLSTLFIDGWFFTWDPKFWFFIDYEVFIVTEEVIQVGEVMKIRVNHPMYQNCKDSSPASYHEAVREAIARVSFIGGFAK